MIASRKLFSSAAATSSTGRIPQVATFRIPEIKNEPMLNYAPGSKERMKLEKAIKDLYAKIKNGPIELPYNRTSSSGKSSSSKLSTQYLPYLHQKKLCNFQEATVDQIQSAIKKALAVKTLWESMPFNDRAAIFLKAADLLSHKYRYDMMAATMLGQGKNVWQAEIDCSAELADFWRFNVKFAADIYQDQPPENFPTTWNRQEYRPLEGFVAAYSPFNFTAIGGNLPSAPALMGNVVLWKPSPMSMYSNHLIMEILHEAGLPEGVIQFLPGDAELVTKQVIHHPEFAGLHFTGSTHVFKMLWKNISNNLDLYKAYPRIVGETGGKNMHFIHKSADVKMAVLQTIRSAFEYNGQKCSACSRVYVPDTLWPEFKSLLEEQVGQIKQGPVEDFRNFMSAVINKQSFDKINGYLKDIKDKKVPKTKILVGGNADASEGYYIEPTVVVTEDPYAPTMVNELFGPVVTVYVYPENKFEETMKIADNTSAYALTGAFFARDREAIVKGTYMMRNAAGNFYINDKSTGAIVGQQPFGGARASGTNDKAGSALNLLRWVSPRVIKESFVPITTYTYPSNQ